MYVAIVVVRRRFNVCHALSFLEICVSLSYYNDFSAMKNIVVSTTFTLHIRTRTHPCFQLVCLRVRQRYTQIQYAVYKKFHGQTEKYLQTKKRKLCLKHFNGCFPCHHHCINKLNESEAIPLEIKTLFLIVKTYTHRF